MKEYKQPFGECLKCPISKRYCNKNIKSFSCEFKAHYFIKDKIYKNIYFYIPKHKIYESKMD